MSSDYDCGDYVGTIRADYEEYKAMSAEKAVHPDYDKVNLDELDRNPVA